MNANRLLIIDDEVSLAKVVAKGGKLSGYDTAYTVDPDDFLRQLKEWQPSVVVVDLQMPNKDGIELLRIMAEKECTAKVIVCSGIDTRTLETARRLGTELGLNMAGVLAKPVRLSELNEVLSALSIGDFHPDPTSLRQAIANNDLYLLYQPKVALKTGKVVAVEALVRWKTPYGEVISPDVFVPMAEEQGVMDEVTDWVLRSAIGQLGRWKEEGFEISVAINISVANLHNLDLPDKIADLCVQASITPTRVTLELTETASMGDPAKMMDVLARFRIKGFSLSIDDFGTGYSSLTQLQRLPFSEIKIDKSFVLDMDKTDESAIIAKTVVDMGHNLGLLVCAEGVEGEKVLGMLRDFGCDFVQGFYFSAPVAADKIRAFIQAIDGVEGGNLENWDRDAVA
jgi:EAL domain-containing protein (putative c-di-GMP-specific phosphodiesterase class I)/ActR/RegA family two-component response regulator